MEQSEAIQNNGINIGDRSDEEHDIKLYQIDNFYLEIYRHREYHVGRKFRTFRVQISCNPFF